MPGTVVTFYSYKGGVGRSFTLANVAVLLARWGYRVLCVDWDLEAPGLYHYFEPMLDSAPAGGVVDLVEDFLTGQTLPVDHIKRLSTAGTLDVLFAGGNDADYVSRIQAIDWESLYGMGFGDFLERCREQWTAGYDFVLLDSRTGVSDIGGICTAHLPDRLVVLFTANLQSIRGAMDIARRAAVARDRMPYDHAQLTILPVLSRFDTREEYDRSEDWRRKCVQETEDLYRNWLHSAVPPELMSRHMTLPYVSYWSFGEQLPVRLESSPGADQIGFALETVAAVVAHDFDRTDLLAENRDAYVAAVRTLRRDFALDVRVSTPRSTLDTADALIEELTVLGVRSERSMSGDRSLLGRIEDDARHLCLLVDGKVSRWQNAEVEMFLHRTLGQDRRVIPVLTADTPANSLPGYLGNLRYIRLGPSRVPADVAHSLVDQLNGTTAVSETDGVDLVDLLRQTGSARLRPPVWDLVDETVRELSGALSAADDPRVMDLAEDLVLVVQSRAFRGEDQYRVAAPAHTRQTIEQLVRAVGAGTMGKELG